MVPNFFDPVLAKGESIFNRVLVDHLQVQVRHEPGYVQFGAGVIKFGDEGCIAKVWKFIFEKRCQNLGKLGNCAD
ncbi:MAG: hypothetical protein RBG13Loki_0912 [Promethearchaeota archaeon CR_4]|nr:MAG: hypothetical protein RBG13Loki_0912 [Candidatus Lokiarchaeota archaeon CR_4]